MKSSKIKKQLSLKKTTVARLDFDKMSIIKGGKESWEAACQVDNTLLPTSCVDTRGPGCTKVDACAHLYNPFAWMETLSCETCN